MAYVRCHDCQTMVHYHPTDVIAFHKRFIEEKEPIYCFNCFKKRYKKQEEKE